MIRMSAPAPAFVLAVTALVLSGCLTLVSQGKEIPLYRFGQAAAQATQTVPEVRVAVLRAAGTFQREAAGDRILTVSGGKVAYIADTRWAAPAPALWDQAVTAAFDANHGAVRLAARGEPTSAGQALRLDVRTFETRYDQGSKSAPEILVRVRVAMLSPRASSTLNEQIFEARVRASRNRVTAIVAAYDAAVSQVLDEVVAWTNERAKVP